LYKHEAKLPRIDCTTTIIIQYDVFSDQVIFNSNVTHEDGSVRLFCQLKLKDAANPESCSFIRPDGKSLYMVPAVSDERYVSIAVNYVKRYGLMGLSMYPLKRE
jgi:hypothetical protein